VYGLAGMGLYLGRGRVVLTKLGLDHQVMIIEVYGNPAPQGSKKVFGRTKLGRTIMAEASDKVTPWRADVMTFARQALEEHLRIYQLVTWRPMEGPIVARMVFSFARPPSVKRSKRAHPSVTPDLSKLARSTEDALQAAGIIKDDALIVEYTRLAKVYCGEDPEALDSPGALLVLGILVDSVPVGDTPGR
jgi:Holliday junction resolvase RusA-like endonuclease